MLHEAVFGSIGSLTVRGIKIMCRFRFRPADSFIALNPGGMTGMSLPPSTMDAVRWAASSSHFSPMCLCSSTWQRCLFLPVWNETAQLCECSEKRRVCSLHLSFLNKWFLLLLLFSRLLWSKYTQPQCVTHTFTHARLIPHALQRHF